MIADRLADVGIRLKRYTPGEHRTRCPACARPRSKPDDALAVRIDDRGAAWTCYRCAWQGGVRDRADARETSAPRRRPRQSEPERHETLAPWGHELWGACQPIEAGCIAAQYLERRGCALPPWPRETHLRWHRDLLDRASGYRGPCLVGLVIDVETAEPINLHRTWLAPDGAGKAAIAKPRRILKGHRSRGVVRLWPDPEVALGLVVGEGIETCLAAARAGLAPVWSTLTAGGLAALPVLPGLEGLTVLVDHDRADKRGKRAGIEAARALVARYVAAGFDPRRDLQVIYPPSEGADAADLEVSA